LKSNITLIKWMIAKGYEDKVDEVFIGSCMTNVGHFRTTDQGGRLRFADIYRHMNFNKIAEFQEVADTVTV
jgi:aconitase B